MCIQTQTYWEVEKIKVRLKVTELSKGKHHSPQISLSRSLEFNGGGPLEELREALHL